MLNSQSQITKRIVFYPEMVAFGGAERIILALSNHLNRNAICHQFALYYLSVDLQSHADWDLPIVELRPKRNPLMKARSLKRFVSTQQAAGSGTALLVGIQAALHAGMLSTRDYVLMILDTPSLLTPRQVTERDHTNFKHVARNWASHWILRRGMRRAKMVIATSQYMADEMERLYGVKSLIARQGGHPPVPEAKRTPSNGDGPLRMLSVSRLEANKRIDWILQALTQVNLSNLRGAVKPSWHLDVVGDGSERAKLEARARSLGVGPQVTFHGFVSNKKLEELYSSACLFLMPALQGYGLPALEALARRIPVVMHRQSGVSEILDSTSWVELIDGDAQSLTSGLDSMLGRIQAGQLASEPLPQLPSESDWAERVCQICGWR